ncbi:MAG TPA: hypothetical protein VGF81_13325 [Solirubrobacteraceae bacterium]
MAHGVNTFLLSNEVAGAGASIDGALLDSGGEHLIARDPAALAIRDRGYPLVGAARDDDGMTHPQNLHELCRLSVGIRG